ncbi:hypothetical protein [Streptomyces sp. NPDC002463]|uniref:hypothetical protein n=1 Tax=Streptomyces sp. NPDC002463 TaxID=3364645 RepID=UPI0036BFF5A4
MVPSASWSSAQRAVAEPEECDRHRRPPSKAPTASARWSPYAGRVREAYGDRIYRRLAEVEATY